MSKVLNSCADTSMSLLERELGRSPDLVLTWGDLPGVDLEHLADIGRVLFGLYGLSAAGEDELHFIGRSEALALRLGCIVGGLVSGDERIHPGGGRLRNAGVDITTTRLEVYRGNAVYKREFQLIRRLVPRGNRIPTLGRPRELPRHDLAHP